MDLSQPSPGLPAQVFSLHEVPNLSASRTVKDAPTNGHHLTVVEPLAPTALAVSSIPDDLPDPFSAHKNWPAYNAAQTNEKRLLKQLLHALCAIIPEPQANVRGRRRVPIKDLVFGEVYREYTHLSGRRFQTDVVECHAQGWLSKPYCYNKALAFLNDPETTDLLRALVTESAKPLIGIERRFAPDSTGFSIQPYGRWYDEKHGNMRTGATYVKAHIITGVYSHIITAASASVQQIGDITAFPSLLDETRGAGFVIDEIASDGAYLSEAHLEWLDALGIDQYTPFRSNSRFHHDNSVWDIYLAFFLLHKDLFDEHYHRRSQAESTFSMVKAKYGPSVRGKQPASQANGVLVKFLANNVYVLIRAIYELGMAIEFTKIASAQKSLILPKNSAIPHNF